MSLISCPECNLQISDHASTCPQCGYPIKKKKKRIPLFICIISFLCIFCICATVLFVIPNKKNTTEPEFTETTDVIETTEAVVSTNSQVIDGESENEEIVYEIVVSDISDNSDTYTRITKINEYYNPLALEFLPLGLQISAVTDVSTPEEVNQNLAPLIDVLCKYDDNMRAIVYICGDDPEFALVKSYSIEYLSTPVSQMKNMSQSEAMRVMNAVEKRTNAFSNITSELIRIIKPFAEQAQ